MTRAHRIANIRCCSAVTPVTVLVFCGPARLASNALQEPSSFRGKYIMMEIQIYLREKSVFFFLLNQTKFEIIEIFVVVVPF